MYETTYTYKCPVCNHVIKYETNSDVVWLLYILLFLPVGLIALIIYLVKNATMKKTLAGEEILKCQHCGSYVALSKNMLYSSTRLLVSDKELIQAILPAIKKLHYLGIDCNKYINEGSIPQEKINLQFIKDKKQFDLIICCLSRKLYIKKDKELIDFTLDILEKIVLNELQ